MTIFIVIVTSLSPLRINKENPLGTDSVYDKA